MTGSSVSTQEAATQSLAAISNAKRIAITTHIRPDGDAVGAAVGLLHLLRDNGYQADLVGLDPIHTKYQFLTSTLTVLPPARTPGNSYNLLVVLDTGALDRAPDFVASWLPDVHLLNIDHHPTNIGFGHTNWVQAAAAAAAEMITSLAVEARWTISPAAAEALWVGITTDTGRFAYSCTTPATLEAAARLLEAGLDTQALDQRVFNTLPLPALRLQALAVHRMELHLNNQLAIIALSREDFRACQATGEDTDDIVNLPRKLDSVAVSIFLHESEPSEPAKTQPAVKASFRTLPPHDAGALCQTLGGGGHARAAGCTVTGTIDEVRTYLLTLVSQTWFSA